MHIAVLITCHNRKEKTVRCLDSLLGSGLPDGLNFSVVLVDDGSSDGTSEEVLDKYPGVIVHRGDGSLFWNRGMNLAHTIADELAPGSDYLLWLNDDTVLEQGAIRRLMSAGKSIGTDSETIVVGATADPASGEITYAGGVAKGRLNRFSYRRVWSQDTSVECDVMNGNIVLVPRRVAAALGNIDPFFEHAMGDTDYALRAKMLGFRVLVASGISGYCSANPVASGFRDATLPISDRWRKFLDRKGFPPRSWLHFVRRHGGPAWPAYFIYPYVFFLTRCIVQRARYLIGNSR